MSIMIFIIILLGILFYIYSANSIKKQGEEFELKHKQQEAIHSTFLVHLNGHPYLQPNDVIILHIRKDTIYFENKKLNASNKPATTSFTGNEVPLSQLTRYEVKTETEISRDVTLTRLVALGIFAFGVKKKTETNTQYLILTYVDNGVEITCIFKQVQIGQELGSIISNLNRIKIELT